jgi:predicted enzyme related to lactoylglutathione lyase
MPEVTSHPAGNPSWVDLGAPDVDAAALFYGALFGWDIQEGPPEAGGYRMCLLNGRPVAGLGPQMNQDVPPYWSTYITVDDADKTAALVAEAGGHVVVDPMDVMTFGRMAVFMDSVGAALSIWQPGEHIGAGIVGEPGSFCWNELMTRDPDTAKEFYNKVFGWEARDQEMPGGSYTMFFNGGDQGIAGLFKMEGDAWPAEMPSSWMVYFAVDDCDASAAKITELGGEIKMAPMDIPTVGRFAVATDPGGAAFEIIKLLPQGGSS